MDKKIEPKKILIVDDDKEFLFELESALNEAGYITKALSDGIHVVMVADEMRPDIIVLDMRMAGKSGFQVADDLKTFPGTKDIPILGMSAYFTQNLHKLFLKNLGIVDLLIKPFHPLDVISRIEWITK